MINLDDGAPSFEGLEAVYDMERKRADLVRDCKRMRSSHGKNFMPDCLEPNDSMLDELGELVFPQGCEKTYFLANVTLGKFVNLAIRPRMDQAPRLNAVIPDGLGICMTVSFHPDSSNPKLTVQEITLVSDSTRRFFEEEISCSFHNFREPRKRIHAGWLNQVATRLPQVAEETRARLSKWAAFLDWKEELMNHSIRDGSIRFLSREILEDGKVRFITMNGTTKEDLDVRRKLVRENLGVVPMSASAEDWEFEPKNEKKTNGIDPGRLLKVETIKVSGNADLSEVTDLPWEKPYFHRITFKPKDANETENEHSKQESNLPETGFIAINRTGELIEIRRQKQVLASLQRQSTKAPYLSNYLFDFSRASCPESLKSIKDWFNPELNEAQQMAVRKMISAPEVCLIQGPPGTGKTEVIAEACCQFASRGKKVLLASQANPAVDNAIERLPRTPIIRPVRLGLQKRIAPAVKCTKSEVVPYFYESLAQEASMRWTDRWEKSEKRTRILEEYLRKINIVRDDFLQNKKLIEEIESERLQLREQEKANVLIERKRLELAKEERRILKLKGILEGLEKGKEIIPEETMSILLDFVLGPILQLRKIGIELVNGGLFEGSLSEGEKSSMILSCLDRYRELKSSESQMKRDLEKARQAGCNPFMTIEVRTRLDELDKEINEIACRMIHDDKLVKPWQKKEKEKKELIDTEGGLDPGFYGRHFKQASEFKTLTAPGVTGNQVAFFLENALRKLSEVDESLATGMEAAMKSLTSLLANIKKKTPEAVDRKKTDKQSSLLDKKLHESLVRGKTLLKRLKALIGQASSASGDLPLDEKIILLQKERDQLFREAAEEKAFREAWEPEIREWTNDLREPLHAENEYLRMQEIVMRNSNVAGITCNQNSQLLDGVNDGVYDVAIIDETSKATPLELLMAMSKAKVTILVGDHRQLPPMFREGMGTWNDALEEQEEDSPLTHSNLRKFRDLVTSSFFKEQFERAADPIKHTLSIQYRMHPEIMDLINPIYEGRLEPGPDHDSLAAAKLHGLTLRNAQGEAFVEGNNHTLWIDTDRDPVGKKNYEENDRSNALEAILIAEILERINEACLIEGYGVKERMPKKEIAVVSFYYNQIRKILMEIRKRRPKMNFEGISLKVDSVALFQGRQAQIVITSLVRNMKWVPKKGNLTEFEQVNVAFSRAEELLIMLGSAKFAQKIPVELPRMSGKGSRRLDMYRMIIDKVAQQGGLIKPQMILDEISYRELTVKSTGKK